MCSADVPPSHFHKICFPLQSWILLCSGVIKSYRSLVCISLLLLLPNLQFHWPPSLSPVWPPSTSNSDCKFDPQRRTRSGWGEWAPLSCWDCHFHVETYAWEFVQLWKCMSFDCILKRSHLPLIPSPPIRPILRPLQRCRWPASANLYPAEKKKIRVPETLSWVCLMEAPHTLAAAVFYCGGWKNGVLL